MPDKERIEMKPKSSSNVEAAWFCPEDKCIDVRFKGGGTYRYPDCDQGLFDRLCGAESVGKFVNEHLKPKGPTKL